MDIFTQAYIETAIWSSTGDNGHPLDSDYFADDLSREASDTIKADCAKFQQENGHLYSNDEQAGHDFWLTRNEHGSGFWDGEYYHGEELTKASVAFGEANLYIGDDGLIYIM